ncbi:unnamed protein product [Rotaria magnacalcarata]|uniref:Uncharacterized protein n=2 Tax=Rotaria magnacalcarata TaxID=392030 RepID=A0A815FQR7_9BILA|nr:unnamed protein product [Rotaria magnacalcarata]CAF3806876.1 unnamed protein product [Rotaria magnacalcarata]CAF3890982.1 unnamed protein product [Rotaria magnacalcarata]
MSSNYKLVDNDEMYIVTLHRIFKIKVIQLINDLNNRLDKYIKTRVKDICVIVNSTFNTNYTETTINEIIFRLDNEEMKDLFHTYNVDILVAKYISSAVTDTEATLICLKPFINTCIKCQKQLQTKFNRSIDIYDIDKVIKGGVYTCCCVECNYAVNEIYTEINREYFSNIWYIYQLCLFTFFIYDTNEFEIPILLNDALLYHFFDVNFDTWYKRFVEHWSTHHLTHPCRTKDGEVNGCMLAFIIDGMQKVARPICKNKNKFIRTEEFPDFLYVGCGNTPQWKTGLCKTCQEHQIFSDNETNLTTNDDNGIYDDPVTGCNVSREDRFLDVQQKMSQGIIYTLSPCGIIIGFDELYRSESCYITLWHLLKIIGLIDFQYQKHLPNVIIYDNACSLFMYFWNRYGKNDINRRILKTSSSEFVAKCSFFIDRFHQPNHKRPMCQKERNINFKYNDETTKKINTEAAEQRNSVLKQYQNALSSYSGKKIRVAYLILFHLMNCERNTCENQFEYNRTYATQIPPVFPLTNDIRDKSKLKELLTISPAAINIFSTIDVMDTCKTSSSFSCKVLMIQHT